MLAQSPKVREGLYVASAALNALGLIVMVLSVQWGAAVLAAGASLAIASGATAANNMPATPKK